MTNKLSEVFKFTQGLGQKGHQIGRKVGDAIEILTLGMIDLDEELASYLIIEDGIEGATTAKHKVEFAFFNKQDGIPLATMDNIFGLIECKKVGVEQTIKQGFKTWKNKEDNKKPFNETGGYSFTINPNDTDCNWKIDIVSSGVKINLAITDQSNNVQNESFACVKDSQIKIALDEDHKLHILGPDQVISSVPKSLLKCIIIEVLEINSGVITKINVNESLPGPQTPEKAKQASFVSLDVRKKVTGQFDKTENKSFISILVIGEANHWEEKSRSMIRLCNDENLIVPDQVIIHLFEKFKEKFEEDYQSHITKTSYKNSDEVKSLVKETIDHFNQQILQNMENDQFVLLKHQMIDDENRLVLETIN